MEFLVLSRHAVEDDFRACFISKPHINISIGDPELESANLPENEARKAELFMKFHDIDLRHERFINGEAKYVLFNEDMAEVILDFVDLHVLDIELIVINCEAGISRSRGTACALAKILNNRDDDLFNQGCPNMKVYNTILNKYFMEMNYHNRWANIYEVRKRSLPKLDCEIFEDEE